MSKSVLGFVVLMLVAPLAAEEVPEFYKSVDRLVWVVEDIDQTLNQLRNLGFTDFEDLGVGNLDGTDFRGKPATGDYRVVSGRFGNVAVHWIQPSGGVNAFAEFLETHGSGVFSLMHRTPNLEALESELERMRDLGVSTLMGGSIDTQSDPIRFAFFDTEKKGKYCSA